MEELTALRGVGRKTANVILGAAFGIAAGVVVDTHVERVAHRLALSTAATTPRIEADLTVVGGRIVYGAAEYSTLAPEPPPVSPAWSPVARFGGHWAPSEPSR